MNRRGFLKGLGAAPVALVALPVVAKATQSADVDVYPLYVIGKTHHTKLPPSLTGTRKLTDYQRRYAIDRGLIVDLDLDA